MARKSRQSFLKRLKEVKRMERATLKRQRRLARKHGEPLPEHATPDGRDPGEPKPTVVLAPPSEEESQPES